MTLGITISGIAKILLLADSTIGRHVEDYLGEKKVAISRGGSHGKLTADESKELGQHLREVTYL